MRAQSVCLALALLGLLGLSNSMPEAEADKPARSAVKGRQRGPHGGVSWRLLVVLAQSQPVRADVQRAWEEAVHELAHTDAELGFVEARSLQLPGQPAGGAAGPGAGHPTALLNRFCTEVRAGKTILGVIVGGGPAARFLVTAAAALRLPTLWLPFSHRDFIRQGRQAEFESRVGTSSEEMGAAAAALMHKAHWHAFTLLIDPNLLPVQQLVPRAEHRPGGGGGGASLVPRTIIYLPTNERTLSARLRRVAEENGRGSVIVLGCDLNQARKVIALAGKCEMLAGRFLWLWLDLKAELRSNEPNIIGTHVLHNARVSVTSDHMPPMDSQEFGPNLSPESDVSIHTLSNLAAEVHKLQGYNWKSDDKAATEKQSSQRKRRQTSARSVPFTSGGNRSDDEEEDAGRGYSDRGLNSKSFMPLGMLALRPANARLTGNGGGGDTTLGRTLREMAQALDRAMLEARPRLGRLADAQLKDFVPECLSEPGGTAGSPDGELRSNVSRLLTQRLREAARQISRDKAEFHLLNLQGVLFPGNKTQLRWTKVGTVRGGREVRLDTIIWPGGGIVPAYIEEGREMIGMPSYKIVTALASPFVMITNLQEGTCLRGVICKHGGSVKCCFGYTMDLLYQVSQDLGFRYDLHVVKDGLFGRRRGRNGTWNGVVGELVTGKAQLAFAPLSVYSHRSQVIEFTTPYYFTSVSLMIAPKERNDIPLLAFLQPFSTELWIAVFTSLNITAMFVAAYEWFSPFGLNPWGRQRSKNFSIASALWVMWGLLCGHLVAFKAPKSWPNKFLINVWGGFSVIFVASYTANIAALIAGLFFHSSVNKHWDRTILTQRVAAPKASAAEYYMQHENPQLWSYMSRYSVRDVADGVERLLNGSLDVLIADTSIIDYYQATEVRCRLEKIEGEPVTKDTYAVALSKGHPLKESISRVIANYTSTGLLDIFQEKWYGGLPCMRGGASGIVYDGQPRYGSQPRPLGVASVAGVFCLLGLGMTLGVVILIGEHMFYKYSLPKLRQRPKNSIWRSRNVMFFSQKLYRFINCVELVSPHHAARELVHTVRQGQITSLFQKSVKRKEHEQRRRRKSKAQFFEMIQEIRRVQQEERVESAAEEARGAIKKDLANKEKQQQQQGRERSRSRSKSPMLLRGSTSPRQRGAEKSRSSTNLAGSRLGLAPAGLEARPREFTLSSSNLRARSPLELVGRRLSHGDGESPPPTPKLAGTSGFGGSANLRAPQRGESLGAAPTPKQRSPAKRGQSFPVFATLRTPSITGQHYQVSKSPLLSPNSELTSAIGRKLSREWGSGIDISRSSEAIGSTSTFTLYQEPARPSEERAAPAPAPPGPSATRRKKSQGDELPLKKPIRRARSHENKEKLGETASPRFPAQPVVGGQSVSERTKKQLESELKAILTARAHHFELHPP